MNNNHRKPLGHACCAQLLKQVLGGFMEFFGKLSHGIQ